MKKILFISMLLLTLNLNNNVYANTKETVKFVKCVDGDTAVFNIDGEKTKVRFLAIDTPETVHPNKEVEAYGKDASSYTCNKITNAKKIELEYDDKSTKLDKYGRILAWVWVDNSLLQKELIEVGYAKIKYVYGKYSYLEELYEIENEAKKQKLGLWSDYTPVTYIVKFIYDNNEKQVKVDENEVVVSFTPEKSGYNFDGWYLNNQKFDFNTKITSNIELTAKFTRKTGTFEYILLATILLALYLLNPKKFRKKLKKYFK